MGRRLILIIAICAVVVIGLIVTYFPATEVTVDVSRDDFMEQGGAISEEVLANEWVDRLIITLCSNPTTGFEWELTEITDEVVLMHSENEYIPPDVEGVTGAAGKEVWTFKVLRPGESTISMEYSQPWEGGTKATWTFTLDVVTK